MRPYSLAIRQRIRTAPKTFGTKLARLALRRQFSVLHVAACTGATRTTVYNWYSGKGVTPAYRQRVTQLIDILTAAEDGAAAWSTACSVFNLPV